MSSRLALCLMLAAVLCVLPSPSQAAASISIVNGNAPGVGFNDPTPVAPVGGNPGVTLGEQRLIAFQEAATIWGATLNSTVPITILASMEPLSCTATSAVLGSAGPTEVWNFTSGVPFPGSWYHFALANKLAGVDLDPTTAQIRARFNSNLGNTGCLTGSPFYLGLDTNHGTKIDLVTVLLHEFAHGLGFSNVTNATTGAFLGGTPAVWDQMLLDLTTNKLWVNMTPAERAASAVNPRRLVWTGANVTNFVPLALAQGVPQLKVSSPSSIAGSYEVGTASFGPLLFDPGVTGELMPVVDPTNPAGPGCTPFNAANALAVNGKIALMDRGTCSFTIKVKNAQNAGAIGVIMADNVAGSPPTGLGGADPTVTIPSVKVSLADGNTLKGALQYRSRLHSGVFVTIGLNSSQRSGADVLGRALLFTPNPFQSGSSVSHWDTIAFPNLLMEPNINSDLTHAIGPPKDLTLPLLQDIGWN